MFGEEFFPTPTRVVHKMLEKVSKDAQHFLDPSAGKGNIAEAIRGTDRCEHSRRKVDCIESNPELASLLTAKGFPVVGIDWLTYPGVCYYDAIVMNPPFSNGAAHLLRAWDFMHNGEIVCLLNQETISNPCTAERKRLAGIIAEHGTVEPLGKCFQRADRSTDVEVALVYLKKTAEDDRVELWSSGTEERKHDDSIGPEDAMLAIRDELGNMEHYYNEATSHMLKAFAHLRKAAVYMEANGVSVDQDYRNLVGLAFSNINSARAAFYQQHRRDSWTRVFEKMQFHKWLDKQQRDEFLRDVQANSTIPFTADNIKGTLENVILQRGRLFEQSVANVFDELTRYFKGNTNHREGWKSNDDFKVNQRLVFPWGCEFDHKYFRRFNLRWSGSSIDIYNDLDRVLCVLDGENFEQVLRIEGALRHAFDRLGHNVQSPFDNTCRSRYFEIKFWMKGTVHLKWLRRDLWEKFNIKAAAGKRWIGRAQEANAA